MSRAFLLSCDGDSPLETIFPTLSGACVVRGVLGEHWCPI